MAQIDSNLKSVLDQEVVSKIQFVEEQPYVGSQGKVETERENPLEFRTDSFHCVKLVSNLLYFCLLCPYKVVVHKTKGGAVSVEFVSSIWRKILWVIYEVVNIFNGLYAVRVRGSPTKRIQDDPTQLYRLLGICAWFLGLLLWPILMHWKPKEVKRIFINSYNFCSDPEKPINIQESLWIKLIFGVIVGMTLAFNSTLWVLYWNGGGLHLLGLELPMPESPILELIWALLVILISVHISVKQWTIFVPSLAACFILHRVSKDFLSYRNKLCDTENNFDKILEAYGKIKGFVECVSNLTSLMNLLLVVELVAQYCTTFSFMLGEHNEVLVKSDVLIIVQRLALVTFFGMMGVASLTAAQANAKFKKMSDWIFETCLAKNEAELHVKGILLQNEMNMNPLGLRVHYFVISYSALTTITSTLITYIFLLLQLQSNSTHYKCAQV